jgi:hypothetical protein
MRPLAKVALAIVFAAGFQSCSYLFPSPPRDVSAESWIALGSGWGFVVVEPGPWSNARIAPNYPTVTGYFMARRKGVWVRLEPDNWPRVVPGS